MRRIFADSSVVIAGAFSRTGASQAVLAMAEIGLFHLVVSRQVIDECERNLRAKMPAALTAFAQLLASANLIVVGEPSSEETARWLSYIETKDAPILAAAVQANVDRLLTLNAKNFTPKVAAISGLVIQPPSNFVREVRAIVTGYLP
jgi:predicted nucleic acid-binding protein